MIIFAGCFPIKPRTWGDTAADREYHETLRSFVPENFTMVETDVVLDVELEFGVSGLAIPRGPDLDNLIVNVFNAFTGVLWPDDEQIVHVDATRVPVDSTNEEYVAIVVRSL